MTATYGEITRASDISSNRGISAEAGASLIPSRTSAPFPQSSRHGAALFTRVLLSNLIPSRSLHSIARLMDILPALRMRSELPFIRCESSVLDIANGFCCGVKSYKCSVRKHKWSECTAPTDLPTYITLTS